MIKKLVLTVFSFLLYFNPVISNDLKIVFVDIDKVINQSNAGKQITKQLENLNNNNIKEFKKKETKLADEEKNLIKQKNILSQKDFQEKVKILQENIANFKREINISRKDVDKKKLNATTKMLNVLNPILADYATKNSISIILQKNLIVIGKEDLDITKEILEIINKKIKKVKKN